MKKIFTAIFILIILQTYAMGNETQKVFLNEAIEIALQNNIDLEANKIDLTVAKNKVFQANRLQNPSIETFYFVGNSGNSEPKQIGVSQNIEIAKRNARKKLATSELNLLEKNYDYTAFDLKMDVREAYINLVAAKSILDTLEQQKQLQEELFKIAQNRVKNKKAPEVDVIQAEIALNQLTTQINSAKMDVKKALSAFNKVINTTENITYDSMDMRFLEENNFKEMNTPPPTTNFPNTEDIVKKALTKRFDIQICKQELDISNKNLTVLTRQKIPDFQIMGGYAYTPGRHTDSGKTEHGAWAGASLTNIPLFYNYAPEINNAILKIRQTELKIISTENKAKKDIATAYEKFLTAAENLNHYEQKIIKGSEHLIDVSKESYEKGETDIVSLIVMKQSYKSIIIGYAQALAEYYNSWTNLLREANDENVSLTNEFI